MNLEGSAVTLRNTGIDSHIHGHGRTLVVPAACPIGTDLDNSRPTPTTPDRLGNKDSRETTRRPS